VESGRGREADWQAKGRGYKMNTPAAKNITKTHGAVIYTRVSTEEQARHGTSLDGQRDACRTKALEIGIPIVAEYADAGVSGAFFEHRESLQRALADIRGGRADTLIATELDRLSRDVEHQQRILKMVRAARGRLIFCAGTFDDTAEGDLNYTFQGGFKQYEKSVIRRRLMNGKLRRLGDGIQVNRGNSPFGYHVPTKDDVMRGDYPLEQLGRYVLVPEQAEIVQWMFAGYAEGRLTLPEIAREMNARGVPTKRGGTHWRAVNFAYIFANPVYKGQPVGGRWQSRKDESRLNETNRLTGEPIISSHAYWLADPENWIPLEAPAIVSEETWERVQERLRDNKKKRSGNPLTLRMLSGRVFCPNCTAPLVLQSNGAGWQYYVCSHYKSARQDKGEAVCVKTHYSVPVTEAATCTALLDACTRPEAVQAALAAYSRTQAASPSAADPRRELAQIDKALMQIADEEAASVQAQIAGIRAGASPDVYAAVFADIAARRKDMEDRRGVLTTLLRPAKSDMKCVRGAAQSEDVWAMMLTKARQVLLSPEVPGVEKRKIVGTIVERVICDKSGATVYFLPGILGSGLIENDATLQNVSTS